MVQNSNHPDRLGFLEARDIANSLKGNPNDQVGIWDLWVRFVAFGRIFEFQYFQINHPPWDQPMSLPESQPVLDWRLVEQTPLFVRTAFADSLLDTVAFLSFLDFGFR